MPDYKSEIRDSVKDALIEKVAANNYGSYLKRLTLARVRGFADRAVTFDFPVTALVGPNGGGKTTILGSAALIYKTVPPRRFFAKSGKYDASMKDWRIENDVIDKSVNARVPLQRTASYPTAKWNRDALNRQVLIFGVTRTIPATERRELVKAVGSKFKAAKETALDPAVAGKAAQILGKRIEGYQRLAVDSSGRVSMFSATAPSGADYSEFHFGAGEASVIRIVSEVEAAEENSLILIEEIENGLHPVASRRLVEYLIDVAQRKSCQVIFTTHSNDALAPLPSKGIWAAYNGEVLQGKLDVNSLRTITGQIDAKLAIFVEDEFSEWLVYAALRYFGGIAIDAVKVHGMGGAAPAVKVNEQHNLDPTVGFPSIALLDGDQTQLENREARVFLLPGPEIPETHVFAGVRARIDEVAARLAVSLQLPSTHQDRVRAVVNNRAVTNRDRHVVFQQIGDDLDFLSAYTVANAFIALWAQEYPEEVRRMVEPFAELLPRTG